MTEERGSGGLVKKLTKKFIQMRCTDSAVAWTGFIGGAIGIFLETMSLTTDYWLYTIEPVKLNRTGVDGVSEVVDSIFLFNSGYFRMCRERMIVMDGTKNITGEEQDYLNKKSSMADECAMNSFFNEIDGEMSNLGKACVAIMARITFSAFLHIASLAVTTIATAVSVIGHLQHDSKSFYGSIVYIIAGIGMCVAVMQYVCVVDDEMAPRMKPTPEGEDSPYKFYYGWSFYSGALSFLCLEFAAMTNLSLYLRKFPTIEDKINLVPGLKQKLTKAYLDKTESEKLTGADAKEPEEAEMLFEEKPSRGIFIDTV